ncbi:MAG: hypothetical protein ACLUSV_05465 [Streptococcus sp.]
MWSVAARRLRRLLLVAKAPALVISVAARSSVALRTALLLQNKNAEPRVKTVVAAAVSAAAVSSVTGAAVAAVRLAAVAAGVAAAVVAEAVVQRCC